MATALNPRAARRGSARERQHGSDNPNRGKRHGARLAARENPSKIRASEVTTRYRPGMTVAARLAGIQAWYDRQAAVAELNR